MKKFITMMVVALVAVSASAASFDWGTGSTKVSFDGAAITTTNGAMGYLVLLTGTSLDVSISEGIVAPSAVSTKANTSTGMAAVKGRISGTYEGDLANGQNYGMYVTYTDADGAIWYNFSSTVYTVSGLADATSSLDAAVFAFDFASQSEVTDGDTITAGSGWVKYTATAVPEPASAMLALAGVAMLIRRRK